MRRRRLLYFPVPFRGGARWLVHREKLIAEYMLLMARSGVRLFNVIIINGRFSDDETRPNLFRKPARPRDLSVIKHRGRVFRHVTRAGSETARYGTGRQHSAESLRDRSSE